MAELDAGIKRGGIWPRGRWLAGVEVALVFFVFFLHGAWPTPDVNETGYITKAVHFWNPQAYAHDFFCNTADAHGVYYWTFGWVTKLGWSLDTVAWVGRIATWLLLAMAWRGLSFAVIPRAWVAVLSAEVFVLLTQQMQMAGEWIIGGVEGKGFAWACVLWAMTALVRGKWNWAWLLLGAATSLHVIVGGWAAICLGLVWITLGERPALRAMLPWIFGAAVLAAPGLYFAWLLQTGVPTETAAQANLIQVYERLPHHLNPLGFAMGFVPRQLLLWALFGMLCNATFAGDGERRMRRFVLATMGLSLVGFVLAWVGSVGPTAVGSEGMATRWGASLLRFYWTRLSDIFVPMGVTIAGLQFLREQLAKRRAGARLMAAGLVVVLAYDVWNEGKHFPWLPEAWGRVTSRSDKFLAYDDWRAVCDWARENSEPGTVFITPRGSYTFKWYSGRDEVGNWKDMPQDAAGVVEWWGRMNDLFGTGSSDPARRWHGSLAEVGMDRMRALGKKYGARYAIVELIPGAERLATTPVFSNESYAVYRLDGAD